MVRPASILLQPAHTFQHWTPPHAGRQLPPWPVPHQICGADRNQQTLPPRPLAAPPLQPPTPNAVRWPYPSWGCRNAAELWPPGPGGRLVACPPWSWWSESELGCLFCPPSPIGWLGWEAMVQGGQICFKEAIMHHFHLSHPLPVASPAGLPFYFGFFLHPGEGAFWCFSRNCMDY